MILNKKGGSAFLQKGIRRISRAKVKFKKKSGSALRWAAPMECRKIRTTSAQEVLFQ
jgi:hypothetical protein